MKDETHTSKEECNCKEMSCPKDCTKNHTHKGFFCEKCLFKEEEIMLEKHARDFCKNTPRMREESGVVFYDRLLKTLKIVRQEAIA